VVCGCVINSSLRSMVPSVWIISMSIWTGPIGSFSLVWMYREVLAFQVS